MYIWIYLSIFPHIKPVLIYLSFCLYIYLSVYLSVNMSFYLYVCLSIFLTVYLSIFLSIYLKIFCQSIYLTVYLSFYLYVGLSVCLSNNPYVHLFIYQIIHLSISTYIWAFPRLIPPPSKTPSLPRGGCGRLSTIRFRASAGLRVTSPAAGLRPPLGLHFGLLVFTGGHQIADLPLIGVSFLYKKWIYSLCVNLMSNTKAITDNLYWPNDHFC